MKRLVVFLVAAATIASDLTAQAKRAPPAPAGPRTIVGVVRDTAGLPIDSVQLFLIARERREISGPDGAFRFNDIKPGTYDVAARRIGYYPQIRTSVVGDSGGVVTFALVPIVRILPPVVATSSRGGLSGIIGDSAYNALPGAVISLLGGGRRAVTDSAGMFFMDAKPGKYMVRITREGYAPRMLSVTIPHDSGRQITALMIPSRRLWRIDDMYAEEMSQRLAVRSPVWSRVYTREDISKMNTLDLRQIATAGAGRRVDESCMAVVDGGHERLPIWMLKAEDLETVEVYADKPTRRAVTSINGNQRVATQRTFAASAQCPATIYVWLRK